MIGAGTFINAALKLVTTVVILGAIYLFFVRPALDTAENISAEVGRQTQNGFQITGGGGSDFDLSFAKSRAQSFSDSLRATWPQASHEVRGCIKSAGKDAKAMKRCDKFGENLVHRVQSNRSFARAYATSLNAQGSTTQADEVLRCVERAGFKIGAMQRCRNLANRYLFGS